VLKEHSNWGIKVIAREQVYNGPQSKNKCKSKRLPGYQLITIKINKQEKKLAFILPFLH
jgi:hypothetical protein